MHFHSVANWMLETAKKHVMLMVFAAARSVGTDWATKVLASTLKLDVL